MREVAKHVDWLRREAGPWVLLVAFCILAVWLEGCSVHKYTPNDTLAELSRYDVREVIYGPRIEQVQGGAVWCYTTNHGIKVYRGKHAPCPDRSDVESYSQRFVRSHWLPRYYFAGEEMIFVDRHLSDCGPVPRAKGCTDHLNRTMVITLHGYVRHRDGFGQTITHELCHSYRMQEGLETGNHGTGPQCWTTPKPTSAIYERD